VIFITHRLDIFAASYELFFLAEVNLKYFGPDFAFTYDDIGEGAYAEEE